MSGLGNGAFDELRAARDRSPFLLPAEQKRSKVDQYLQGER